MSRFRRPGSTARQRRGGVCARRGYGVVTANAEDQLVMRSAAISSPSTPDASDLFRHRRHHVVALPLEEGEGRDDTRSVACTPALGVHFVGTARHPVWERGLGDGEGDEEAEWDEPHVEEKEAEHVRRLAQTAARAGTGGAAEGGTGRVLPGGNARGSRIPTCSVRGRA